MKKTQYTVTEGRGPVPLCYSGNKRIFHGLALSALSAMRRTKRPLHIYILTMDLTSVNPKFQAISAGQAAALDNVARRYHPESRVILLDATQSFENNLIRSKNVKTGYTPYTLLRLLLDEFDVPEKLLYIDVDTMCVSDIAQLYDIEIEGYEFAAVADVVGRHWIRPSYCNAGVLLLNVPEMKKTGLFAAARKRVNKVKMFMPDQSALNFLSRRKLILPDRFNEQRAIKENTVIKHFCKGFKWYGPFFRLYNYKQWDRENVHTRLNIHEFDDDYEEYDRLDEEFHFREIE